MLGSSFGSVSSSLRRTSANDRSDEIFTCSTAMVCDAKVACAVVWVMCALHIMGGIGFLTTFLYGRSYSGGPAEVSIPFLLDEKSIVVPVRLAGEQSNLLGQDLLKPEILLAFRGQNLRYFFQEWETLERCGMIAL